MLNILKDIYNFRNVKWRFEFNDNWLVRENDDINNQYFFDITYISESLFNAVKNFKVVSYQEKIIKNFNYFQKIFLVIALRKVLNDIKILATTPNINKLKKETKTREFNLNTHSYNPIYFTDESLILDDFNITAGTLCNIGTYETPHDRVSFEEYNLSDLSFNNEIKFKIKERARKVIENSISFYEIIRKNKDELENIEKKEIERNKIKEIIKKNRKNYN